VQAEDGIRDFRVTGVQTCALPIWEWAEASAEERENWHPAAVQVATETMLPVRLRDLSEHEAHLLALADNKLGELADWDEPGLARSEERRVGTRRPPRAEAPATPIV